MCNTVRSGCKRLLAFRAAICRPSQISPATAPLVARPGLTAIPTTARIALINPLVRSHPRRVNHRKTFFSRSLAPSRTKGEPTRSSQGSKSETQSKRRKNRRGLFFWEWGDTAVSYNSSSLCGRMNSPGRRYKPADFRVRPCGVNSRFQSAFERLDAERPRHKAFVGRWRPPPEASRPAIWLRPNEWL